MRRIVTAMAATMTMAAGGACSGSDGASASTPRATAPEVRAGAVPATLVGLTTAQEDVSKPVKRAGARSYAADVKLWSVREGDRLRATIEIGRFSPDAPDTAEFRHRVAGQLGAAAPRLRRVGRQLLYVAPGNRQTYYMWFRGMQFVLLGVPSDSPNGRAILRAAVTEVRP